MKNIFLKISLHFLVEDDQPFHLICELFFYCQQWRSSFFLFALQTDSQTDERTVVHFFEISSLYWFQWYITLCGYLTKHQPSAKQYVSTVTVRHNNEVYQREAYNWTSTYWCMFISESDHFCVKQFWWVILASSNFGPGNLSVYFHLGVITLTQFFARFILVPVISFISCPNETTFSCNSGRNEFICIEKDSNKVRRILWGNYINDKK